MNWDRVRGTWIWPNRTEKDKSDCRNGIRQQQSEEQNRPYFDSNYKDENDPHQESPELRLRSGNFSTRKGH